MAARPSGYRRSTLTTRADTLTTLERPRRPIEEMEQRRAHEANIEDTVKRNNEVTNSTQRAKWERKTHGVIKERVRKGRISALTAQHENAMTERRQRLASLLAADAAEWRREVEMFGETIETRKKRLSDRARALGERREKERQANVDECYRRQRRAACDDVRSRDSQAVLEMVAESRKDQIVEKASIARGEVAKEERYVEEWRASLVAADRVEADKVAAQLARQFAVKDVLDEQVRDLARRKEACRERRVSDAERELVEWRNAMERERAAVAAAREDAKRRGADVAGSNNVFDQRRAKSKVASRAEDLTMLEYVLRREREDDAKDDAKIAHEKDMAHRYKAYLDGFEKVKEEDEAKINAERLKIENRIWERKDQEQRDQVEARLYLMAQVDLGRKQQMADKAQAAIEETSAYAAEITAIRQQQLSANREEDRQAGVRRAAARTNQAGVRELMVKNAKARADEKQAEYLEARVMDRVEKAHAQSVANEGGIVNTHHPLQSTKWYT